MKILGKNVLLKSELSTAQTESGIIVPESARNRQQEATVEAIGSQIKYGRQYTKGTKVFVEMYKGKPFPALGHEYTLVEDDGIIGVAVVVDGHTRYHPVGNRVLLKIMPREDSIIVHPSAYDSDEEFFICQVLALNKEWEDKNGKRHVMEIDKNDFVTIPNPCPLGRDVEAADGIHKLVPYDQIVAVLVPDFSTRFKD